MRRLPGFDNTHAPGLYCLLLGMLTVYFLHILHSIDNIRNDINNQPIPIVPPGELFMLEGKTLLHEEFSSKNRYNM